MEEGCSVVRYSTSKNSAQIENLSDIKLDENVKTFKELDITPFYLLTIVFSMFTFILDMLVSCWLVYIYYELKQGINFALTLGIIIVPALIITAFSMRWYIIDEDERASHRPPLWRWGIRIVMLLLQLAPLLRYCDALSYGLICLASKKSGNNGRRQKYLRLMLDEDCDASLLRLIHCFLNASPQAILQLTILLQQAQVTQQQAQPQVKSEDFTIERRYYLSVFCYQAWAVLFCLVSVAWAITGYHRSVRSAREDKEKITPVGTLMMFCWNLLSTVSRVLALSILASLFPAWFGTVCLAHWAVMSLWLAIGQQQTAVCNTRCEELIFSTALGLAYVIAFISPRDGPTRYSYLAYYLVCFMENTGALVIWCVAGNSILNPSLYYGTVGAQLASFILCLMFMFTYYKYCHPSGTSYTISKSVGITDVVKTTTSSS